METILQKWENSDGIRIPKSILKSLNLKTNDIVVLKEQDNKIIISKKEVKVSLAEKFKNYEGPNLVKDFSLDCPQGKELW